MHRQLTLILALSLLLTVVLPIHVLAGSSVDGGHLNLARAHRMLKKRAENPIAALLGGSGSQGSAGNGGAENVSPQPTVQPQNGNTAGSTDTTDGSSSPTTGSGQTTNSGTTTGGNGAGSGTGTGTGTGSGGSGTGSQDGSNASSGDTNTGTTNSNSNSNGNAGSNSGNGNPIASIVTGILGGSNPAQTSKPGDTPAAANSTSSTSSSTSTSTSSKSSASSTSSSTSSSSSSSTPSSTPPPTLSASSNSITTMTSTAFAPNSTAPPTDDDSNPTSSTTITRNTIIILVAIGASVGVAAIVWTVIRKWKFRPSSNFNGRMQPINWEPSPHDDDGGIIAERLNRNPSTRSHGSFTSGTGHAGANEGLVSDLPPLDAMTGPNHLAPVGGYANLQRGPSPQPMYELPNPHQYPVSQQQYYNPGQGSAYGYRG